MLPEQKVSSRTNLSSLIATESRNHFKLHLHSPHVDDISMITLRGDTSSDAEKVVRQMLSY